MNLDGLVGIEPSFLLWATVAFTAQMKLHCNGYYALYTIDALLAAVSANDELARLRCHFCESFPL
jgi:hypothetical protein